MLTKIKIKGFKSLTNAEVEYYTHKNIANKNKNVTTTHKFIDSNILYTFNLAGIIGGNATGKSSFLDAIYIYKKIITNKFEINKNTIKNICGFEKKIKLFTFEYIINNILLQHELEFNEHFKLIKEKLFIFEKQEWKTIFENDKDYCLLWRIATISEYEKETTFKLEERYINLINNLYLFIKNITIFDNVFGVYEHHHFIHDLKKIFKLKDEKNKRELKNLKILINAVDPNIIDIKYDSFDDELITIIKEKKQEIKVPFENISEGTKRFLYLMRPIIMHNDRSNFYIIDEIENSFHPRIIDTILRLFYYNQNNLNNSQLLFTTHNPYIFDIAKIHNSCINISLYNQDNNFEKLSNFENYDVKRNDKLFSKNYILEIINSHPDSDSIDELYNRFNKEY